MCAGTGSAGRRCAALVMLLVTALNVPSTVLAASKTDVVVLVNGDRITGEIKALEHNRLKLSTDHMGTVYIEWDKIARLQSDQFLLLERADGVRYYGQLKPSAEDGQLQVDRGDVRGKPEEVAMLSIVGAQPIVGGRFIDRLDGYVSGGFDLSKASNRRSFDLAAGLSSRTRVRDWTLDGSANLTDDAAGATSDRYQLQGAWRQFRRQQDFYAGFGGFERNSELDLNLRTLLGAGLGRFFLRSPTAEWQGGVGLAYVNENYTGGEKFNSLEAAFTTGFSIFRYDFPETDIGGTLTLLPSLTKTGRYRAQTDLRAKYEFVDDLYFELKFYGTYDSDPPSENTQKGDYGVVTSLGYSF
jgi:hypothetical protein